jgi:5-methylcytosine-specific restriction endonuclease McrA
MTDWIALTDALLIRSGGHCESCGGALPESYARHHRLLRKHGGRHVLSNLVVLHHECHHRVHFHPVTSYQSGHLVRAEHDPVDTPIFIVGWGWVHLADNSRDYLVDKPDDAWLG